MTITAPSSGTGNLTVTANGTSGSLNHSAVSTLSLQDFTVTLSPYMPGSAPTITAGATQTFTISAAGVNGYAGNVGLTWSSTQQTCRNSALNLPSQVEAGYAVTMTLTPLAPYPPAVVQFSDYGSVNGDFHNLNGAVYVSSAPTFSFALSPAQGTLTATPTTQAATVIFTPTLTPTNFCGYVSFQVTGLPTGATAAAPQAHLCNASLTEQIPITVAAGTPPGTYPLSISASGVNSSTGQTVTQYINPNLQVSSGASSFLLSISPSLQSAAQGGTATYTVLVTPEPGTTLRGGVGLTVGTTAGASAILISHAAQPGVPVTLTVSPSSAMALGVATILVTGTVGSATETAAASLSVQALIVSSSSPAAQNVAANGSAFPTVYSFSIGSALWITAGTCSTGDPNITATVSNQRSSSAVITYTANVATTSRSTTASCSYTCPSGTGRVTLPPVTVSPAPIIFNVTDAAGNPNPAVYAGVPTTLIINGAYFGTTQGGIGLCPDGASPCIIPTSLCNPSCGSYGFLQWNDSWVEVVLTLPPGATGEWDVYVMSTVWISAAAAANPSRGTFAISPTQIQFRSSVQNLPVANDGDAIIATVPLSLQVEHIIPPQTNV